jgi:hypothetical protein
MKPNWNAENSAVSQAAIQLFFGNLKKFNTDQFHYHKGDKTFSQEASTLDIRPGTVYDAIKLTNPKTGGFRIFSFAREISTDSGEDVGAWEYKSGEGIILVIFND